MYVSLVCSVLSTCSSSGSKSAVSVFRPKTDRKKLCPKWTGTVSLLRTAKPMTHPNNSNCSVQSSWTHWHTGSGEGTMIPREALGVSRVVCLDSSKCAASSAGDMKRSEEMK
eukprot:Skav212216  [mRNA]  locus=scaffold862:29295:29630:- [translate_table: standard]